MVVKLRGQGPKTFISYSFGNPLASGLAERLLTEGFQVTLVDDRSLLSAPSLSSSLVDLIQQAEIVVPVLDAKANCSQWVQFEIATAMRSNRIVLPLVQDNESLPTLVRDIPYITERNLDALVPAVLKHFALLPLDPRAPFQLEPNCLRAYLESDRQYTRVIWDSSDLTGQLLSKIPESVRLATEQQPDLRSSIELQVSGSLKRGIRLIDRAQQFLPRFRNAIESTLQRYGSQLVERSIGPWQRMTRLITGIQLLEVAQVLHPEFSPEYWEEGGESISNALRDYQACVRHGPPDAHMWALRYRGDEARNGWLDVYFIPRDGLDFRGLIPKTEYVSLAVQCRERPASFLDPWHWADFGIPQLFRQAVVLADRFDEIGYLDSIVWNLDDYTKSSPP